jgi:hypothetical protein
MTWSLRQLGHALRCSETKIQHVSSCSRRNDFIDPPKPFETVRDFRPSTRCSRGLRASGHREKSQKGEGINAELENTLHVCLEELSTSIPRRHHYIYA